MRKNILIVLMLIISTVKASAQNGWDRLPEYHALTMGLSYSSNRNNIPDSVFGTKPGSLSKSVIIPSFAIQADGKDGYVRYQPSVLLVGDLIWDLDDEVNRSLLTGGLFGNFDDGINFISEQRFRAGAGGTVEDYILVSNTNDKGYHLTLGPNAKCDYLLSNSLFARFMLKYVFSIYHFVGNADDPKLLRKNSKHPQFFTWDAQLISRWGVNIRLEYWKAISRENSSLELSRFWIHSTMAL